MERISLSAAAVLIPIVLCQSLPAQPTVMWAQRYPGGNGTPKLAVDSSGNIYVAGKAVVAGGSTFLLIKYTPDGTALPYTLPGAVPGNDMASAVTVDALDNVYVTGRVTSRADGGSAITTMKVFPDGNYSRYDDYEIPGKAPSLAGIAVDAGGNVYISGMADASSPAGWIVLKYDAAGRLVWAKTDVGGKTVYEANGIALDSAGNCYVTAVHPDGTNISDILTIKYDPSGNELWSRTDEENWPWPATGSWIAVDQDGNAHIAGLGQAYWSRAIEYDTNGNSLWAREADDVNAQAAALAANGSLYLTGSGEPMGRFGTVAYDGDGTLLWDAHYNPPDTYAGNLYGASAIALDSAGGVYITGAAADGRYYVTVKYDANGRQLWEHFYDMGPEAKVAPSAIAVDRGGNVIVTGYDRAHSQLNIIKYSQNNAAPTLSITKTHTGNFSLGQQGASYGVTVSNQTGQGATSGAVTVTETIPPGLTLVAMEGTGWTCAGNTCTRSDALSGGASYPEIKVTVNVALNAPDSVVNVVGVSGGGSGSASASDFSTIIQLISGPALSISKSHTGNFSLGQQGATYGVTVSNFGQGATSGVVTVTETIPPGLTLVAMEGTGWTCAGNTCTRSDALSGGASYPEIKVTVNVAFNAPDSVVNVVGASGGGSGSASASDVTTIIQLTGGPALSITKSHTGNFSPGQQGASYGVTVSNQTGQGATSGALTVTDTIPSGLTLVSMSGNGWACSGGSCTRSDALNAGATYAPITVTVNVAANAPAQVTNVATVSGGGSASATASDVTQIGVNASVPITINTNPPGLLLVVDGSTVTSPQNLNWAPGATHSIGTPSPQGSAGTRYLFGNWNDGGAQTHDVTPATATTYTASFAAQYLLTATSAPASAGSITANPTSADGYYTSGRSVQLTASANSGFRFANWSGDLSGSSNPATLVVNAPRTVTANFSTQGPAQVRWTAVNPPPRNSTSMALDAERNQIVLFGGSSRSGDLADTWIWDGDRWTMRSPANSPPARERHAMAYDAARGEVVLFSGYGVTNDTWVWDGNNWTRKNPSTSPPALDGSAMAYDAARGQVVLFGGNPLNNDTWVWDGSTWTKKSPANKPPARWNHAMVYDEARGQVVLFGGLSSNKLNDTWVWDGTDWTQKTPATSPPGRNYFGMGYDSARAQVVVFGGSDASNASLNDTWIWDGNNWTPQSPTNKPPVRSTHAMAYDSARAQVLIFGGTSYRGDTWCWNGTNWSRTSVAPPPRIEFSMAYDSARRQVVLYGGYGGNTLGYFADTWVWDGARWIEKLVAGPGPRRGHSMAYDAARAQVVLFGGTDQNSNWYNDVWAWDGTAWTQKAAAGDSPGIPSRRTNSAMAYDAAGQRVLLFGGEKGPSFGDTWLWDGNKWASAPGGPPARHYHAMAYDAARGQVVLFGGANPSLMNDTWTWDGSRWTQKNPAASPAARSQHDLAYNTASGRVVLFGGFANVTAGDTWEWNGSSWTQTTTHTDHRGDPASWPDDPGTRYSHRMAYDEINAQVVLFGGTGGGNYLDDTWVYPF